MHEIEGKIIDSDKAAIIKKLEALGCELVKDESQVNTIYDFPDLRLLSKKGYARVREVKNKLTDEMTTYLTLKLMLSQEKYKIMEEHETLIQDASAGHGIFTGLGLIVRKILIKDRTSYRYKHTLIEIDEVAHPEYPFPLLEIETAYEDELKDMVELLGYTMADTTSMTMAEIMACRETTPL